MAPPPYPLFHTVLAGGNLHHAMRLARELPVVALSDAAKLLRLMAVDEMGDPARFERGALRWLQRFMTEVPGVDLQHVGIAVRALGGLDHDPQALTALLDLCTS